MSTQPPTSDQPTPATEQPAERSPGTVWIVNRTDEYDGLYVFLDEHRARAYAERHDGAVIGEEVLMNDSAAAQFLLDTADEDTEEQDAETLGQEEYDHSRAKEDARNAHMYTTDAQALSAITTILQDPDWAPGMLEDIAELVAFTGRDPVTPEGGGPTWNRH